MYRLITPPSAEPVTLAEAKKHLNLEITDDDAYVTALIVAARQYAEEYCWRALLTQTWERVSDRFEDPMRLGKGNVQSITSVTYLDDAGLRITLPAATYVLDTISSSLRLAHGNSWPGVRSQWDAVIVRFVAGWTEADVPQTVKQAILLLVSQMYEHRTPEVTGTIVSPVRFAFEALLSPYRVVRF